MALSETELARRVEGRPGAIEARNSPLRVAIRLDPPPIAADGLAVHGETFLRVAVGPSPADRQLLADELLGDRISATAADVADRFASAVRAAVAEVVGRQPAAEAIVDPGVATIAEAVGRAADRCAFRLGLVIVGRAEARLHSPAAEAAQRHARQLAEIDRAGEVARRFAELRAAHPGLPPAELLGHADPAHRDAIAAGLLRGARRAPAVLWVASGEWLVEVRIDADVRPRLERTIALADLGPLRCVRQIDLGGSERLAVGARGGVIVLDPAAPAGRMLFRSAAQTDRGFNAVATDGSRLLATHGELGLAAWSIDGAERRRWPAEAAADLLRLADGTVLVGERRRVRQLNGDDLHEVIALDADLVALLGDGRAAVAVLTDGQAIRFAPGEPPRRLSRPATVTAGGAWHSAIGFRLLRATMAPGVEAFGFDDAILHHYAGPHASLRMVAATGATLAAVTADRQRLVFWDAAEPSHPAAEVHVTAATRHRIGGMCFS